MPLPTHPTKAKPRVNRTSVDPEVALAANSKFHLGPNLVSLKGPCERSSRHSRDLAVGVFTTKQSFPALGG